MRAFQFWVLLVASIIITGMIFKEISLSKALFNMQRTLTDNEETAQSGAGNYQAWNKLAIRLFEASKTDPALVALLHENHIMMSGSAANSTSTPSAPPASSKVPAPAVPPAPALHPAGQ